MLIHLMRLCTDVHIEHCHFEKNGTLWKIQNTNSFGRFVNGFGYGRELREEIGKEREENETRTDNEMRPTKARYFVWIPKIKCSRINEKSEICGCAAGLCVCCCVVAMCVSLCISVSFFFFVSIYASQLDAQHLPLVEPVLEKFKNIKCAFHRNDLN